MKTAKNIPAASQAAAYGVNGSTLQELLNAQMERVKQGKMLHCYRCSGEWYPKRKAGEDLRLPTVCALCKNPRWIIPRPVDNTGETTQAEQRALDAYLTLLRARGPHVKAIRALIEAEVERLARGGAEG
jgi:hypothetical protein